MQDSPFLRCVARGIEVEHKRLVPEPTLSLYLEKRP